MASAQHVTGFRHPHIWSFDSYDYFYPPLEQEFVPNNREEFQRLFFYKGNKIALQISSINF